ncbi:STAS/SEC14 domain-containing protein [Aquimarina sp. 2201CG5-10]|uniref:STAS/SEC14 domain-containing protein n=1 Tax=Aquimarina callyspongiae TaxID=3098150 RepID=UPI002AB4F6B9|nr:STAS/SEC14 domain-containing protein [Aquimarina sp. 2201CG5-10]MDY8138023.1 STAS/SEC14 domain-containing protein [Aquimarina sp. 2201CG5-10]
MDPLNMYIMEDHAALVYTTPTWKHHMNVEYIEIDFTGLHRDEDVIQCVADAVEMGLQRSDKSVRALVYLKNSKTSPNAIRTIKKLGKMVQPKMNKSALVGSVGIVSLLMKIYISYTGSKIKFFTDKEAAIKYLAND